MSEIAQRLAAALESEGEKTLAFFRAMESEDWQVEVYSDGPAWKVHDLLAHFTEVEGSIPLLIRAILDGESGVAEDFDIDRYNARFVAEMGEQDRDYLMGEFAARRRVTVEMVHAMNDSDLKRSGRHPFLGLSQVKDMLKLMYLHIQIHQRDIRKAFKKAKKHS